MLPEQGIFSQIADISGQDVAVITNFGVISQKGSAQKVLLG